MSFVAHPPIQPQRRQVSLKRNQKPQYIGSYSTSFGYTLTQVRSVVVGGRKKSEIPRQEGENPREEEGDTYKARRSHFFTFSTCLSF